MKEAKNTLSDVLRMLQENLQMQMPPIQYSESVFS